MYRTDVNDIMPSAAENLWITETNRLRAKENWNFGDEALLSATHLPPRPSFWGGSATGST
jgi:hypothetical protein